MNEAHITIAQAAQEVGTTYATIYHAVRAGRLPAIKPGRDWLVTIPDVQQYLDSRPDWAREEREDRHWKAHLNRD